jgi:hypothetical protein
MYRLLVSLLLSLACAQALADPPVRVARLGYVHGSVSFSPAGTDDWALASLNRPLIAGDRLWTEPAGRDELQLGGAAVRMDGSTLLSILTLDDRVLQVQLSQGTLNVHVRPGPAAGTIEIDTPNLALSIDQPGHYRVGVDPAGDTTVVRVDDGQAQAMGQYQTYAINPGQYLRFSGPDLRNVQALDPRHRDDFDRWAAARDQRADRALASRYVSPAMIGYDDLDDYGTWRTVPAYGHVWIPRNVQRGWAPYRDGHWAWIEPWGWTWIDDAPWGFAVTHYGRWAKLGGDWAWMPEPANAMPVYAPALVAFVAIGNGMARSPREPDVAWFPLGPREAYRPPYKASPRYLSAINYNIANVTNNEYVNRQVDGAVTGVPVSAFTRAQPVRHAAVAVPRERVVLAQVLAAPQVQARRESMASHLAGGHRPAAALLARTAMTHMRPAIAHAQQQPAASSPQGQSVPQHQGGHRERAPVPMPPAPVAHNPALAGLGRPSPMPAPVQRLPERGATYPNTATAPNHEAGNGRWAMRPTPEHGQHEMHGGPQAHAPTPGGTHEPVQLQSQQVQPPRADAHRSAREASHGQPQQDQPAQHPEPPRAQPQQARPAPHPETSHAQPAPHPEPPHGQPQHAQPMPHPEPPHVPHTQPHAQPPAQPAPHPEPPRGQPQHAQPAPHGEPVHAPPPHEQHPSPEPAKDGPEHGHHGHKDEHH